MCQIFSIWLGLSGHSLLSLEKRHFLRVSQLLVLLIVVPVLPELPELPITINKNYINYILTTKVTFKTCCKTCFLRTLYL